MKWTRTVLQGNLRGAGGELLPLTRHFALPGTPSGRLWELCAILISIVVWQNRRAREQVACLETDSKAALFAWAELSSNTPTMDSIAAEIGLRVISPQIELVHVVGVANYDVDVFCLSRRCQGKASPSHLAEVRRAATPCRESDFLLAWSGVSL